METKICTKCGIEKLVSEFSLHKNNSSGFKSECKTCVKKDREAHKKEIKDYAKAYYIKNRDALIAQTNAFRESNKEKVKETRKSHYKANAERLRAYSKRYSELHKEERSQYSKEYESANKKEINKRRRARRKANPEKPKADRDKYREKNKERIKENARIYYLANKKKIASYIKANRKRINKQDYARYKEKYKTNPQFRLSRNMAGAIRKSLKNNKKGAHWETLVGYTIEKLRKHIEKQFVDGMTWENYGYWHLEHKIPKSVFNYTKPNHQDFKRCWALNNLQPMWAKDNMSKGAKLSKHFQPSLLI